jgi:hypothetical protein
MKRLLCLALILLVALAGCYGAPEKNEKREYIEVQRAGYPVGTEITPYTFTGERLEVINKEGIRMYVNSLSKVDGYLGFTCDIYNDNKFDVTFQTDSMMVNGMAGLGKLYKPLAAESELLDVSIACLNLPTSALIEIPSQFEFYYAVTKDKTQDDLILRSGIYIKVDGVEKFKPEVSGTVTSGESVEITIISNNMNDVYGSHEITLCLENLTEAVIVAGQWQVLNTPSEDDSNSESSQRARSNINSTTSDPSLEGVTLPEGTSAEGEMMQWDVIWPIDDINNTAFLQPGEKGIVMVSFIGNHDADFIRLQFTTTPMYTSGSIIKERGPGVACNYYPQSTETVMVPCTHDT